MDNRNKEEIIEPEVITEVEKIEKVNKNAIATIHNNLIQARHKLSLEEIRLMDTIISFIQPEDNDLKIYKIPVSIFQELYGSSRKDIYDVVKRAVEGLLSKPIKIEGISAKGKKVFKMFNFISYGEYEEGAGNFYISIDSNFRPYLLQLKEFFTKIPIKYTYVLNSRYSIRLYELLKQYENTGFRVDYLPDLREMLGVEPKEYPRFDNFERRVLKTAVKEINEKTDIEVSYIKKKTGRKITHIEFKIKKKPKSSNDDTLEKIKEKAEKLNQGDTTQTKKMPSQTIDNKGQKQEKKSINDIWEEIAKYRKQYKDVFSEIEAHINMLKVRKKGKINRLTENQLLFLMLNVDKDFYDEDFIISVIKDAIANDSINNIMGYLVDTLDIDMKNAKFKELIKTNKKVDEEIETMTLFTESKSAISLMSDYLKTVIKPKFMKGEIFKEEIELLKPNLAFAVVKDSIVYIPVRDRTDEGFVSKFVPEMIEFLKEKHGIKNIKLVYADINKIKKLKKKRLEK